MINVDVFLDKVHDAIQEIKGMSISRNLYYDKLGKALMGTVDDVAAIVAEFNKRGDFYDLGPTTQALFHEIANAHLYHNTESIEIQHMIGRFIFLGEDKCKENEVATQKDLELLLNLITAQKISDVHARNLLLRAKERISNYGVVCAIGDVIANLSCATVRDLYNSTLNLDYNTPDGRDQAQQIIQKMQNILDAEIDGLTRLNQDDIQRIHNEARDIIGVLHRIAEYVPPFKMNEQIQQIRNKYSEKAIISRVTTRLLRERGLSKPDTSDEFRAPDLNNSLAPGAGFFVPTVFHPARNTLQPRIDISPKRIH